MRESAQVAHQHGDNRTLGISNVSVTVASSLRNAPLLAQRLLYF
jgi:hypothetical protein